jgi:hypothetical protein
MEEKLSIQEGLQFSLNSENSRLSIKYSIPGTGSFETFFTSGQFTPHTHSEIILSSGFQQSTPPGKGVGTKFYETITRIFSGLAKETGETIVHPVFPTSDGSRKFFAKQGYQPDLEEKWHTYNEPQNPWYFKIYSPESSVELDESEQPLVDAFKKLLPVRA